MMKHNRWYTVLDPDLQMGEGGWRGVEGSGGHPDPAKMRGEVSKNFFQFFSNLGASVWSKNKGGGGGGWEVGRTSLGSARSFPSYRSYIFHICK